MKATFSLVLLALVFGFSDLTFAGQGKGTSDYGSSTGFTVGCGESQAGHHPETGQRLQALAASAADSEIKEGRLASSERDQWIKAFIEGYREAFAEADCLPD